ncbi:3-phosphoshikimate 1-carboxyvinyltransferase [Vulcanimicrobium alpinum]|uniref:3-phosphoshikimate 1-carboxyvinyltransferase n=2 Tax=Vulcanimicrobium alpinum TaxID=3016050 RepID=A0AAN1XZT0_UNVUL|nr:3-phosphoshikimate 1-carboxyvinyltransferase [Vulcanimicrobium alpinum]
MMHREPLAEPAGGSFVSDTRTMMKTAPHLRVPGDKSIAHRAVMFAALARGTSRLRNVPDGLDVLSTQRAMRALGATLHADGDTLVVEGCGGAFRAPDEPIDCGNSGTTMRLVAGILATRAIDVTLTGDDSLRARPMRRVAAPLAAFGATIDLSNGWTAPMRVRGNGDARGAEIAVTVASAQVKSALLLAALGAHGPTRLTGELATRDHTERLLAAFSVHVRADGGALVLDGPAMLHAAEIDVPGDISSAAFLFAAAAATAGGTVTVDDVGLNPTRTAFLDVLRRFGAEVEVRIAADAPEPRGSVTVRGRALHAIEILPSEVPGLIDELPLVGVLGAFANGTTTVRGAAELRVKESDRIESFAAAARALGADVETAPDGFAVHGPARWHDGAVATHHDHRIAMAFAVAGRVARVRVTLDDPDCAAVSFPNFAAALESLA